MNWSVHPTFVGNVFGAPLAIEELAAFMFESTFLELAVPVVASVCFSRDQEGGPGRLRSCTTDTTSSAPATATSP